MNYEYGKTFSNQWVVYQWVCGTIKIVKYCQSEVECQTCIKKLKEAA